MYVGPKFSSADIQSLIKQAQDPMRGLAFSSGGSILDAGRRINRSGIGMSQTSRQALEGFFSGATGLFNQLYAAAENQEVNNVRTIMALRSKYSYLVSETVTETAASDTSGTKVDTKA